MPISVEVRQFPHGEVVATLFDMAERVPPPEPPGTYDFAVPDGDEARFPLLRGVEPYGDTCFNRRQSRLLLAELDTLEGEVDGAHRSLLRALKVLISVQLAAQHRYLWFIGDRTVGAASRPRGTEGTCRSRCSGTCREPALASRRV